MIPQKGKTYAIACLGPYEWNKYGGLAKFTGRTDKLGTEELFYEFILPDSDMTSTHFSEKEIICEKCECKR